MLIQESLKKRKMVLDLQQFGVSGSDNLQAET